MTTRATAIEELETALERAEVDYERQDEHAFLVTLPGQRKLATKVWLGVGSHSLRIKTFFCRQPDENHAAFYQWLLRKSEDMYVLSFVTDDIGDVYLSGRLPLHAVTADEVDRLLGCALTYSDENFNPALERGFASSIRREWQWRTARGVSKRNLAAFRHLIEDTDTPPDTDATSPPAAEDAGGTGGDAARGSEQSRDSSPTPPPTAPSAETR
ncbi:type III secretion system chaperone family protein [Lipingzhangella rawalii]|uniref:YbjN domain-containing protein n=1 Tax=Lipingzhangella rawalii TaxID=2055835 RepID=UPI0038993A0D